MNNEVSPPYWLAIGAIILGIVTTTIMPSVVGVFMLIKCFESSKAKSRGDFEEARRLARQAWFNPFGIPPLVGWIIGGIVILLIVVALRGL